MSVPLPTLFGWLLAVVAATYGTPVAARDASDPPLSLGGPEVFKLDRNTRAMIAADLDGNGYPDLALINNDKAKIQILYQYGPDEPSSVSAADIDGDGRAELYVASQAEEAVGVTSLLPSRRLAYPEPLPVDGKPLALSLVPTVSGTGWDLACLLQRDKHKQRYLVVLRRDPATGKWQAAQELALAGMRTNPTGLKPVDLDRDGLTDLVAFALRTPAWLLHRQKNGTFKTVGAGGLRRGLLDKLQPGDLSVGDVDRDGRDDILLLAHDRVLLYPSR